jgi:hypothetical protein
MTGRELLDGPDVDDYCAAVEKLAERADLEAREDGRAPVEAWPEPTHLGRPRKVRGKCAEPGEEPLDERVLGRSIGRGGGSTASARPSPRPTRCDECPSPSSTKLRTSITRPSWARHRTLVK